MAYKDILSLDADVTISLGGTNKKTGKKNPTQIEGYFLGHRLVDDRKNKSGKAKIYFFQTEAGNVGVWGKTDMDRKMQSAVPGAMTKITFSGMRATPNGDMYTYKVQVDVDNAIEVADLSDTSAPALAAGAANDGFGSDQEDSEYASNESVSEDELNEEDAAQDAALAVATKAKAEANRAKVQALLNRKK